MDKLLIEEKLESLRRSVSRVEKKYHDSKHSLLSDYDAQDVITLNLTRAVQLSVDIASHIIAQSEISPPLTMGESFLKLLEMKLLKEDVANNMIKAVGFRNIAIHSYEKIDWNIVSSLCEKHLQDFKEFAKEMDRNLLKGI